MEVNTLCAVDAVFWLDLGPLAVLEEVLPAAMVDTEDAGDDAFFAEGGGEEGEEEGEER